jgi:hypothetical protein
MSKIEGTTLNVGTVSVLTEQIKSGEQTSYVRGIVPSLSNRLEIFALWRAQLVEAVVGGRYRKSNSPLGCKAYGQTETNGCREREKSVSK